MRHEKISLADHAILPAILAGRDAEGAEEKDAKGPPVYIKHFHFCGRMPSRRQADPVVGKASASTD